MTKTKQIFQFSLFALLSCFMLVGDARAQGPVGEPILIYKGLTSADGVDLLTDEQVDEFLEVFKDALLQQQDLPNFCTYFGNGPGAARADEAAFLKAFWQAKKTVNRLRAKGYLVGSILRYDNDVFCNGHWRDPKTRKEYITYTVYYTYEIWGYPPSGKGNVSGVTSPEWSDRSTGF